MKNHKCLTPWAAPKKGLAGVDWATPWVRVLNSVGLPGKDFILKEVSADGSKLFERVAHFRDMLDLMRRMLTEPPSPVLLEHVRGNRIHVAHLSSCDDIEAGVSYV